MSLAPRALAEGDDLVTTDEKIDALADKMGAFAKRVDRRLNTLDQHMMAQFEYLLREIHRIEDRRPRSNGEPQTLGDLRAMNPDDVRRWVEENLTRQPLDTVNTICLMLT